MIEANDRTKEREGEREKRSLLSGPRTNPRRTRTREKERRCERGRGERDRGPCNRVVETGSVRLVETQGEETPMVLVLVSYCIAEGWNRYRFQGNQYGYGARHTGEGTRAKATYSCIFMCPPKKAKDKSVVDSLHVGPLARARARANGASRAIEWRGILRAWRKFQKNSIFQKRALPDYLNFLPKKKKKKNIIWYVHLII